MRNDQWLLLYRRRTSGISIPRIQLSNRTAAEDETADFVIGTLSVANSEASWTFSITADPDSKFKIANDDELQLDDTLDYETAASHSVTIQADNGVDTPITRTFTISVTNVLEVTLAALSLDTDEIEENSAEDTVVGAVQDKSTGSTLTLIDDAGGRFKLSGTNIVAGATNIDYEAATSYEITLRETHADASNSPRDTVIEITVIDDADDTDTVPDAFEAGDWSIAAGDEQADVTISDLPADGGDTITDVEYRLDGGSWVSSGGTSSFTVSGLTNDQEYDVELRAVNSIGAGPSSDVKSVTPAEPSSALHVTDDFNRANGGLGDDWTTYNGSPAISSNKFSGGSGNNGAYWAVGEFAADQYAQAAIGDESTSAGHYYGVGVRMGPAQGYAWWYENSTGGKLQLWKSDGSGGWTMVGSTTTTGVGELVAGDVLRAEVEGDTHRLYINDVLAATRTDSSFLTGGAPGLDCTNTASLDNFAGGDFQTA